MLLDRFNKKNVLLDRFNKKNVLLDRFNKGVLEEKKETQFSSEQFYFNSSLFLEHFTYMTSNVYLRISQF